MLFQSNIKIVLAIKNKHSESSAMNIILNPRQHNLHQSFSLVEMLVAIAILAILTSLLSPALRKAVGTANGIQCASNLKTIGAMDTAYADDHASTFLDFKTIGDSSSSFPDKWYQFSRHVDHATNKNAGATFNFFPKALEPYGWERKDSTLLCPDEYELSQEIRDNLTNYKGVSSYAYRGNLSGYYKSGHLTPIDFYDGPNLWLRFCSPPGGSAPTSNQKLITPGNIANGLYAYNLQVNPGASSDLYRHFQNRINTLYLDLSIQTREALDYLDIDSKKLDQDN
jgi:prepilin-type N-terminal cleavage/methylation domain-containing protein